jgi:hypothetical protein
VASQQRLGLRPKRRARVDHLDHYHPVAPWSHLAGNRHFADFLSSIGVPPLRTQELTHQARLPVCLVGMAVWPQEKRLANTPIPISYCEFRFRANKQLRISLTKKVLMKTRKLSLLMLAGSLMVYGCEQKTVDPTLENTSPDDVRRDVGKAVDTVAVFSQQTQEELKKSLDLRLKEMEAEISKFRLKGHDLTDQAKISWDQKIAELEIKREAALAKLAEVGRASSEAWRDVQKGAQSAFSELDKALREASSHFIE